MTDETAVQATEESAPTGLDNIINSAIDAHYVEDTPTEAAPPEAAPTDSRPRDAAGRFISGEAKQSTGPAEAAPPTTDATPVEQAHALDAPTHYTVEQKAAFASLPRESQEYWVKTEKEREADFTRRSQEAAEFKRTVEPLLQAVSPYHAYLSQLAPSIGQTPAQMVNAILATEYQLRNGSPQQKAQAFAQLAQTYGVDPRTFASGNPAQHQPQQTAIDPTLLHKIQEHDRLFAEQQRDRELQHSQQQITAFSGEKDEHGQPKYPYFDKVRAVMASIVQSGQADNLADAYRLATDPIRDVIDRETKAAELARTQALEKAKKATPVKTSSGALPKGGTSPKGLDAHISAAMERAGIV